MDFFHGICSLTDLVRQLKPLLACLSHQASAFYWFQISFTEFCTQFSVAEWSCVPSFYGRRRFVFIFFCLLGSKSADDLFMGWSFFFVDFFFATAPGNFYLWPFPRCCCWRETVVDVWASFELQLATLRFSLFGTLLLLFFSFFLLRAFRFGS